MLEDVLVRQGIPYQVIGGPRFYERAEIKDAVAYLQVIDNTDDAVSLMRIANRPRRGIGDASVARLRSWAEAHGESLFTSLGHPEEPASAPPRHERSRNSRRSSSHCSRRLRSFPYTRSWRRCSSARAT